eukprot:Lithocolla_globosa_v1_NODE_172_length_5458_cov_46.676106.p2 type:complete len:327 gc:universal NODE_172_length_5458_cov_46.676106:3615-2635(-)
MEKKACSECAEFVSTGRMEAHTGSETCKKAKLKLKNKTKEDNTTNTGQQEVPLWATELRNAIKDIQDSLQTLVTKKDFEKLQQNYADLKSENETFRERIKTQERKNKELEERTTQIETTLRNMEKKQSDLTIQTEKDHKTYAQTVRLCNLQTQHTFKNDIIINGLPEPTTKELQSETQTIFHKLTLGALATEVPKDAVEKCHRLKGGAILIRFKEKTHKLTIMEHVKKHYKDHKEDPDPLTAESIGSDNKIYFNHHTTTETAQLFKEARRLRNDGKLKFVWICKNSNKLLARRTDTSSVIPIESQSDLEKSIMSQSDLEKNIHTEW